MEDTWVPRESRRMARMRSHIRLCGIKHLVSDALCVMLRAPLCLALRLSGKKPPGKCVVLYYHAVRPDQARAFENQVDELLRLAKPITASEIASLEPGGKYFAITFDDAFASVLDNAIPVLAARKIPCIVFVPTGYMGRSPGWEHEAYFPECNEVVASTEQLLELSPELVTIGSHTVMHSNLVNRQDKVVEKEMRESKEQLETLLEREVHLLAFPYGRLTPSLLECARTVGYKRVFGTEPNACCLGPKCYMVGRVNADPSDGILEFRLKIHGAFCRIPAMTMAKNKLKSLMGMSPSSRKDRLANGVIDDRD